MLVTYDDSLGGLRKVGEDGYIYRLKYSKTQQVGAKADSTPDKPILGRSAEALTAWLEAAAIRKGAIFRWIGRIGPALLPGSVATIVKRRTALAGLEGDFGAHSLRFGLVAEAGKQGVSLAAVMAMTEHRSVVSVIGYFQAGAAEDSRHGREGSTPCSTGTVGTVPDTSGRRSTEGAGSRPNAGGASSATADRRS